MTHACLDEEHGWQMLKHTMTIFAIVNNVRRDIFGGGGGGGGHLYSVTMVW